MYYTQTDKEIKRFYSDHKPVNQKYGAKIMAGDVMNITYIKNQISPRDIHLESIYKFTPKHKILIKGKYSLDFFFETDRTRWSNLIKTQPATANKLIISELFRTTSLKEKIWRDVVEAGYFSPIHTSIQNKFFDFILKTFKIKTITIPWNMGFKTAFEVDFMMVFDLPKFIRYNIIEKRATMHLNFIPNIKFNIGYIGILPKIFMLNKGRAISLVTPFIQEFVIKDRKIAKYVFSKTKLRIDQGVQLKVFYDYRIGSITFIYQNLFNFIYNVMRSKTSIFGTKNAVFKSQPLNLRSAQRYLNTSKTDYSLLIAIALYSSHKKYLAKKHNINRTLSLKDYIKLIKIEIKRGTLLPFLKSKK